MKKQTSALQSIIQLALLIGIAIFANILASFYYSDYDLTEDKRFTLTEATYRLIDNLDDVVSIEIYLEGEFPSSFKHLQSALKDILDEFRSRTDMIQYRFVDPLAGNEEERNNMVESLRKKGIMPVNLTINTKGARGTKQIFPSAIIRYKNTHSIVNLLENFGGVNSDYSNTEKMNTSINLLEYKLASGIQTLQRTIRPKVLILAGHGELRGPFIQSFRQELNKHYSTDLLDLNNVAKIDTAIDVLIIPKPRGPMGDKHLFMIDQYVMNGGNVIWLIDRVKMETDSLRGKSFYIPNEYPLDIHDMLFNYGVRINTKMALSWDCSNIKLEVGMVNNQPQTELRKWFYYPVAKPYTRPKDAYLTGHSTIQHPIVKNINEVWTQYPTTLDTLITRTPIKKTILLRTAKYSKYQMPPVRIGFDIIDVGIGQDAFNKGHQDIAVLLDGQFESHFRNRVPPEMLAELQRIGQPFLEKSKSAGKMLVVSDGDFIKNDIDFKKQILYPLGLNSADNKFYDNNDFILNTIQYMVDKDGIIAARAKKITLRPLDQDRAYREETKWRMINLVLPLVILGLFGFVYTFVRRKRFG
ncbi:MAG: gliding motility-associated ABC transporter substrate-binding protein GldG [Aureispira sp.]|nr:gliding motility-associated ABC transporter substrate-binding protein GldG [Aureispira sp.]